MTFPDPIPLPDIVFEARQKRRSAIMRAASLGMCIRLGIIAIEMVGFFLFSSMALLVDSLATAADCISSILLLVSIALASRPPDTHHPFGHGRFEPLAGLQLGIFLAASGFAIFSYQIYLFFEQSHSVIEASHAWFFALVSVILLEISHRVIKKIAERQESAALLAEAFHFRADSLNSVVALVVLGCGAFLPEFAWYLDRLGALGIALFMCIAGVIGAKKNIHQLLDRIPDESIFEKVRCAARSVDGVCDTEKIRIQQYGPDAHIDIDVEVDPALSVEAAHTISQHVRTKIQIAMPAVQDVIVHIEPYYPQDHC